MLKLTLLCLGTALLLSLSEREHPVQWKNWEDNRHFMSRQTDGYMLIAILWMASFAFLRTNYNDTAAYIRDFSSAQEISAGYASGAYLDWLENPFSSLYRDLMHSVSRNYHVYFMFPALLQCAGVVKLCKYYSDNPPISLMIFFCIGTYTMLNLAAFKQGTAFGILLLALPYAQRRQYGKYVLLVALATLFHFYAIVYLLVPLLFDKPWGKTTWLMLVVTVVTLLTYDVTLGTLMSSVNEMGGSVAAEELFDGNSINVLRVAVYWAPGLLALVFRRHVLYNSTRMENLIVNLSILCACILTIGLAEGANLYGRMAGYFEIFIALAIPLLFRKIFTRDSGKVVSTIAAVLFFGYFYYEFSISKDFGSEYRAISLVQFALELIGLG